ncbi:MAG: 6-phosphogluconolactonase [Gammaproteobacteria bacterium]|nr:6-phosphogluconolactonase [Gammaproteobacteria bacterium]
MNCFDDNVEQSKTLAARLASDISDYLNHQQRVSLCLPGGTTPGPVFDELSRVELDWRRVDVLLSDERWVSVNSPLSNEALLRDRLACNAASEVQIVSYYDQADTIRDATLVFNQKIEQFMPLDICVLGMGLDGHFASLFTDMEKLEEALDLNAENALVLVDARSQPMMRVSLNLTTLAGAKKQYLLVRGEDKKMVLETVKDSMSQTLPVSYLFAQCPEIEVYYAG